MTFRCGDNVVWRSRPQGQVASVIPATVVEDSRDVIAIFQHDGSVCMRRTGRRGGPRGRSMLPDGWDGGHRPLVWNGDVLRVHIPGAHHSVMRHWSAENGQFHGWYVNLESDWTRTPIGFDSLDLVLDVVADEGLNDVRLKDEDELAWSEQSGTVTKQEAARARAEAAQVLEMIERRTGLFGIDWSRWRPDDAWPIPALGEGWKST